MLFVRDRDEYEYVRLFANLLEVVPVGSKAELQVVLQAVHYYDEGMTPFDTFHAATTETRGLPVPSSDGADDAVDPERLPLEPEMEE